MLGVTHRSVLGLGPPQLATFFVQCNAREQPRTRQQVRMHRFQLVEPNAGMQTALLRRSLLGLISVYNILPSSVVESSSVAAFQTALQSIVKGAAASGSEMWEFILSPRQSMHAHPLRKLQV